VTKPQADPADFAGVEREARRLRKQFEAGDLDEGALKARLKDLMIQDRAGRWWIVGYETGRWYVHTGEDWSESEPPTSESRGEPTPEPTPEVAKPTTIWRMLLPLLGGWAVAVVLVQPFVRGFGKGEMMPMTGLAFGIITGLLLRRNETSLRPKHVAIIALGWAFGQFPFASVWWLNDAFRSFYDYGHVVPLDYLVGGTITAIVLRSVNRSVKWYVIALGWAGASLLQLILYQGAFR